MNKKTRNSKPGSICMVVLLAALGTPTLSACSGDNAGANSDDTDGGQTSAAYLVAVRVHNVDGQRIIYMGAFSDVPTSNPSRDNMVELVGRWQVTTFEDSVFAWEQETGQMTRWSVDDDLNLEQGATMSLGNLGLTGWRYHAFVSPTRAYTLGLEDGIVAVWNPETMEIEDEIQFDVPADFDRMSAYPLSVVTRDDHIFAPMYGDNFDALEIVTRQVVGVIDTQTDEVSFITDERCLPSGFGRMVDNGDIYLDPYQSGTYFTHYSIQEDLPPPCTLRIQAGETTFDPDYVLNYEDVLGRHADGVWPISGNLVMALSVAADAELPPFEAQDDYWSLPQTVSLVDVVEQTAEPYGGLPEEIRMQNAGQHITDGISYYQNYRYKADGDIEVVEVGALTESGWEKRFEITGGDLWALHKLR